MFACNELFQLHDLSEGFSFPLNVLNVVMLHRSAQDALKCTLSPYSFIYSSGCDLNLAGVTSVNQGVEMRAHVVLHFNV